MGHTYIHADYHDVTHIIINPEEIQVAITERSLGINLNDKPVVFEQPKKTLKFEVAAQQPFNVDIGGGANITYLSRTIYQEVEEMPLNKEVDFITDNTFYKGEADPGSAFSAPAWRIKYVVIQSSDGDVSEKWANGTGSPVHIWDNRASYSYS